MARLISLVALFLLVAACGGGGGGDPGESARFLTADPRGTTGGFTAGADAVAGGSAAAAVPNGAETAVGTLGDIARLIEEADLYRVDGDTLYLLNAYRGLVVVDLAALAVRGRLALPGAPKEMYLRSGRALVLVSAFDGTGLLLDVSLGDPANPALLATFPLGQGFVTSRFVGDVLYAVSADAVHSFQFGPALAPVDSLALPAGASFAHATDALLAVARPGSGFGTEVVLVDISDPAGSLALRGAVEVAGWIGDEFKLHIGAGTLRVVTHDFADGTLSRLSMVSLADLDLPVVVGTLALARGEQLFATRFTDDVAYIVTFERVDPLWVIDLADPANPTIAGFLVVPGWSTHLVALPGRLVGLGIDPDDGWHVIASLFDVSDPANPALLDRADFGWGWSQAFSDVKSLGVFPAEGLVLVPVSGDGERLAVLDLGTTTLDLRGTIDLEGVALRGFPHPRGLVAATTEEVLLADPVTLAVEARVAIAENVVDAARLPDGRLVSLVARRTSGKLGDVPLPLVPDACYPVGARVAVTGHDASGRAAYVVDFAPAVPTTSGRLDLGGSGGGMSPPPGSALPDGLFYGFAGERGRVTPGGRVVLRRAPEMWFGGGPVPMGGTSGSPGATGDGFLVIDVPSARLDAPIDTPPVTGFALDGETLVITYGGFVESDGMGRPWMRHDLVRVHLGTRAVSAPQNVPGFVVAAVAGVVATGEELWDDDWVYRVNVVACDVPAAGPVTVLSRLALPDGSYDLRAAGATLFFTSSDYGFVGGGGGGGGGGTLPPGPPSAGPGILEGEPWMPTTTIGTVRLAATLAFGPSLDATGSFATLLLPEDGAALLTRDGMAVERWSVSGPTAVLDWTVATGVPPLTARADLVPGSYLLALGYAGLLVAP
jgi:hypothetical protein